jgi:hypothetical protein
MIPARELDKLPLSFCETRWLKVARIIGKSMQVLENGAICFSAKVIDPRMAALVRNKQLEAAGDIRKWRYSEVRLPAGQSKGQNEISVSLLLRTKSGNGTTQGMRVARIQRIRPPLPCSSAPGGYDKFSQCRAEAGR